jgi:hypothetical protein
MEKQGQQRIPYSWLGTSVSLKTVHSEDLLVGGTLEQVDSDGVVITYLNSEQDGVQYKETGFYPWTSVHHLYTKSRL